MEWINPFIMGIFTTIGIIWLCYQAYKLGIDKGRRDK